MKCLLLLALGTAVLVSCGDEFETEEEEPDRPCNENPWSCPEGQTCWPNSMTTFACLNDGPGGPNAPCNLGTGSPECQAGLLCYQTEGYPTGSCRPFCDPANAERACMDNTICDILRLSNGPPPVEIHVCRPPY